MSGKKRGGGDACPASKKRHAHGAGTPPSLKYCVSNLFGKKLTHKSLGSSRPGSMICRILMNTPRQAHSQRSFPSAPPTSRKPHPNLLSLQNLAR